jgi:hypothetical protein
MNHRTLFGKSTKIRIKYRDIKSVEKFAFDQVKVFLKVALSVGQDLRSQGNQNYSLPLEYHFIQIKPDQREELVT